MSEEFDELDRLTARWYLDGFHAAGEGKHITACPYPNYGLERDNWQRGWITARKLGAPLTPEQKAEAAREKAESDANLGRRIQDAIREIASRDPQQAEKICKAMIEGRKRRQQQQN